MNKLYKFADTIFEIAPLFNKFAENARDYEVCGAPAIYKINCTKGNLKEYKSQHEKLFEGLSLEEIEENYIYNKVGRLLTLDNKFIIHGSSVYLDNIDNGYLFTAPPGTGKSTHSRLLIKVYGDRVRYINDDKPFISNSDGVFYIYGGPWNGKERKSNNVKCLLKGIFIVERGHENKTKRISSSAAINYLVGELFISEGKREASNSLKCLIDLCKRVPIYILNVDMSDDAAKASYEIMNKKETNYEN